jgi:DNA (cytosine-5)-methyltransferase 1
MSLRIGSLFSGYGGLDMAVQDFYGAHVVWYSEIDKHANTILATHYPGVPNLGDIKTVNWADVPPVDILTGGYPCQPFSHAGSRKGKEDERHLWPYVRDAIAALRPVVTVLENVDGHRSLGFADVLGDIAEMGMSARWGVIRAAEAGAPHGRKRIFIIAYSDDARRGEHRRTLAIKSQFPSAQYVSDITANADGDGHGQQLNTGGMASVEGAAAGGASERQRPRGESDAGGDLPAADADSAGGEARRNTGPDSQFIRAQPLGSAPPAADADGDRRGKARRTAKAQADRSSGADSGCHRISAGVEWGQYGPAISRWERVSGRSAPEPTIPGANGRPRLSPIFVEWMMGLPAGHVTGHGLRPSACLKILGNGVVPQQAALALRMLEAS